MGEVPEEISFTIAIGGIADDMEPRQRVLGLRKGRNAEVVNRAGSTELRIEEGVMVSYIDLFDLAEIIASKMESWADNVVKRAGGSVREEDGGGNARLGG
jgi:hypothetical protein